MIKEKKGIGAGALAVIILTLSIFVILIFFTDIFTGILKRGGDIEVCRLSVLAQARTKVVGKTPISLECSRRQVKFFNNKVEINGKKEPKYDFKELDDEVVNKVIAEELRLCWYMMGEGKIDVFRQDIAIFGDRVCTICSEVSFDKKVNKNKKFNGLVNYLKGNKIQGQDVYYFDYLINSQRNLYLLWGNIPWTQYTPWSYGTTNKIEESFFQTDKNYVIYFLGSKPDWLSDKIKAFTSAYYIGLGDPGKAAEECKRLVN